MRMLKLWVLPILFLILLVLAEDWLDFALRIYVRLGNTDGIKIIIVHPFLPNFLAQIM